MVKEATPTSGDCAFRPGERVCWIGDSISRGGLFHSYVHRWHLQRGRRPGPEFHNCGLSGDSAEGVLRRMDWDIVHRRPTLAVVMLGMNDVCRDLYDPTAGAQARLHERQAAISGYAERMEAIVRRLQAIGARIILLTPTPYDQTGCQAEINRVGVDDALAACADQVRDIAARHGTALVEFHEALRSVNRGLQAGDPLRSIIGEDRVHPGPPGHLLMAHLVLAAQACPGAEMTAMLDAAHGRIERATGCEISDLAVADDGIACSWLASALPFTVPEAARPGLAWIGGPFARQREVFSCTGLVPARYRLCIDDQAVCIADARELAAGIDLVDHPLTPQYRQAEEAARHHAERHRLESDELRTLAAVEHFVIRPAGGNPAERGTARTIVEAQLERDRREGFAYGVWQRETWLRLAGKEARITADMRTAAAAAAVAATPRRRRVRLARLP